MLSYTLDEIDSLGPFGQLQNVVAKLDQDHSDSIDRDEAKGLLSVKSDVRLLVRYPLVASGSAEIEISSVSEDLDPLVQRVESANHIAIVGSALSLTASVLDARTGRNQIPLEAFAMLDANNDGGLDESEIPAPALREYSFEDLDQDEDGKLTLREINEGMSSEVTDLERAGPRTRRRVAGWSFRLAGPEPRSVFIYPRSDGGQGSLPCHRVI